MIWTLVLLFLSGVLCNKYNVKQRPNICAVRGSTIVIPCSFYYPAGQNVQRVMWAHGKTSFYDGPFIFENEPKNTFLGFRYIGDRKNNCSLEILQVKHNNSGEYAFRFETNSEKWTSKEPTELKIVDLKLVITNTSGNKAIVESDSVNLTCVNSCDDDTHPSAFIWLKNGNPVNEGPVLYLSNISSTNSGNYSCSLKTQDETTTGVISINVEYGPKNTTASVTASTEVDAGSDIGFTCSSHANPSVEKFTWFKRRGVDFMNVGNESELYFWRVSSERGGEYFCSATNKHGSQNSSVVTLQVKAAFSCNTFIIISAAAASALLIVIAIIVLRRCNKKRTRAPETNIQEDIQDEVHLNYPIDNNGQSPESTTEPIHTIYTVIDFGTKRKLSARPQMDTNDDGVIYSIVCRDQKSKPSHAKHLPDLTKSTCEEMKMKKRLQFI